MQQHRILHIEDSKTDADLIKRSLQKSGLGFQYLLASNKEEVQKGLDEFVPDLILCDHSLPSFNSKMAYAICKEKNPDLPFILVTGTVSEEFAVDMIQTGVDDYLLKSNLQRLPVAIDKAFSRRESEKKINTIQRELLQSETNLRTIFENSSVGLILVDRNYIILELNDLTKYYNKISFGRELVKNENLLESIPVYRRDELQSKFEKSLKGERIEYESVYPQPNGSVITFNIKQSPAINSEGIVTGVCIQFEDITEQKEKERHLKLLESVITHTTDAVLITEAEAFDEPRHKIVFVNEAFTKMTGYSSEEVIAKTPKILQGPKSDKAALKRFSEAIRKWQSCEITTINYKKNGEEYWVNFSVSPVANENGWHTHWIAIERDVTEHKLVEIQLKELNDNLNKQAKELAISNAELEQFAYIASHDLQEPLRMVTSFLSLLEKKYGNSIDDKGKEYIGFAVDGAQRMRQIILDLLEFSRVGRMDKDKELLDLNELMDEIKLLLKNKIEEKHAVLRIDRLPQILAYRSPIRQVFQNLISNALNYSSDDISVQINITVKEMEHHWQFAVSDNGIGIQKEYFDKIFIIFQRLHKRKECPGTGMGLAITKKIIEKLGGTIWVESEVGKGSTFYFTITK